LDFLLKVGYYGVSAIGVLLFGLFFLGNLFSNGPTDTWVSKMVLLVSGLTGVGIFVWSMAVGHFGGNWGAGILMAVGSVAVFGVMMLAGLLMFTTVNWQ
jgi:hypothetical protein